MGSRLPTLGVVTSPVSWDVAQRVATWVGTRGSLLGPPGAGTLDAATMAAARGRLLRGDDTRRGPGDRGHRAPSRHRAAPAALVLDRAGWVRANVTSFRRLLEPVLEKLEAGSLQGPLAGAARRATGAQMGLVLGWMATRVLGQYDLLLAEGEDTGGVVSYVGPNIVALEKRHGFPTKQFRLWIALHEVTHRCQFTGVPWLRPHFLSLVDQAMSGMAPDPKRFADALRRAAAAVRAGHNPLEEAGMLGLVAPPEQLEVIGRIQAMMSLLEGHGDITMDRAGADAIPDAALFSRVLRERRRRAQPAVAAAPAARRPRGQAAPVRGGGAVHPRRGGDGGTRAAQPGVGGAGDASHHGRDPPSRDVGDPHRTGSPRHRLMASPEGVRRPAARPLHASLPPASPLVCAVSGGPDSLALLALAVAAGCVVTAVHVDHGLRPGSAAEGRRGGRGRGPARGRVPRPRRSRSVPGPNLEARARAARRGVAARRDRPPVTPWTTRPRRSWSTSCGGRASTGWPECGPAPTIPLLGIRRSQTHALCARARARSRSHDPSNTDRRFVRNRVRHELLPLASAIAGRDLVPVLARQAGGPGATRPSCSRSSRPAIDPSDAEALGRRAGARWPAGRRVVGCGVPGPTLPTWPRWNGSWPWPGARCGPPTWLRALRVRRSRRDVVVGAGRPRSVR